MQTTMKTFDKLSGLPGADFDKEFISDIVSNRAKALSALTTAERNTKDADQR